MHPPDGARRAGKAAANSKPAAFVFAALLFATTSFAHAGLKEGRVKAQVCAACHGADGNSTIEGIPSLAGQPKQFIVMALYMFREGRRKNDAMTPFTEKPSNADLNDLAQYFSSQKIAAPTRTSSADMVAKARAVAE